MSTTKRITKRLIAVVLTVLMLMSMVTIGMTSASAAYVDIAQTGVTLTGGEVLYCKPNSNWLSANQQIVAYFCNGSTTAKWVKMTDDDGDNIYKVTVPTGNFKNVIFTRHNNSVTSYGWNNNLWNQTNDLVFDGTKNFWIIAEGKDNWSKCGGAWDTYGYYVRGSFNNWGVDAPMTNNGDGTWSYTTTLVASTTEYEFKIGTANWGVGYPSDDQKITVSEDSNVTFTLSAKNTVTVTQTPVPAEVPDAPTAVTFSAVDTQGNGAFETPFVVKAGTEFNIIVAPEYDADGFTFTVNDGEAQTGNSFKVTAPEAGKTDEYTVSVVAYNTNGVETKNSDPLVATVYVHAEAEVVEVINGVKMDAADWFEADGLYAYADATDDEIGTEAWQCWDDVSGHDADRYFYLPASASDNSVIIYNNYGKTVVINGTQISAGCYNVVPYENGTKYTCEGADNQTVKIMKSDAEGTLYFNNDKGMSVVDPDEKPVDTSDFWGYFHTKSTTKNSEALALHGAIADEKGVDDAPVKKFKGRGNTTWNNFPDKRAFNITYEEKENIDGMLAGKKWSLLANAQDTSLIRNRLVYDLSNEVGMKYACDSRFVDVIVNGDYKGSYQLTQKIELGKTTVMYDLEEPIVKVEKEGDVVPVENFDFVLELDTEENALSAKDKGFETSRKQWMTFKTPDDPADQQIEFIKEKYQAVEDALYGDELATLESLIDINDFVRAYLVNEVAKNLDSGVTSCYFVYDSEAGKFFASPLWDYDNAVGNSGNPGSRVDDEGNKLDLKNPEGWYARELMHYNDNFAGERSVFSQACHTTSKLADGRTFNELVKDIFNEEFLPALEVLDGTTDGTGRLKDFEGYWANLENTGNWNYKYAGHTLRYHGNFDWINDHSSLTMYDYNAEDNTYTTTTKGYDQTTFEGQSENAVDWAISRINWMAAQYNEAEVAVPDGYITVYFENNWKWPDAQIHFWGSTIGAGTSWPGMKLTNIVGQNADGYDIYEIVIPGDVTGIVFHGTGEFGEDKSEDITEVSDGLCYYMVYDETTKTKIAESYEYKPPVDPDDPIDPDDPVVEKMNIFLNATAWAQNGATYTVHYVVPAEGEDEGVATASIGEDTAVMSLIADNVYVAEIPANATNVQFAKNTVSNDELAVATVVTTDLLTIENGKNYYTITDVNAEEGTITGSWSVYGAEPGVDPEIPAVGTVVVYVVNSKNWEKVNAYIWSGSGDTAETAVEWPGMTLQPTGEKSTYGSDVYAMTFESKYTSVLFNNGTLKTKDLTVKDGQYYDLSNGQWYETLVEVPDPLPVSDPATVYFQNNWLWTEVSVYAYDADGNEFMGGWPGQAMELYGNDGTYDVYKAVIPSGATGFVINGIKNNSTEADKTPDITTYAEGDCFSMMWADKNTVVVNNIDVILPPAMTTVYLNVADVWNVADGIVAVDDAVMENIHGTFYKADIREDATEITFSLTQTSVEEGANVTKLTVPATREEGKDLFTLTAADAGEWGVYEKPIITKDIFFDANGLWALTDTSDVTVSYAKGEETETITMELVDGLYKATVPADADITIATEITSEEGDTPAIASVTTTVADKNLFVLTAVDAGQWFNVGDDLYATNHYIVWVDADGEPQEFKYDTVGGKDAYITLELEADTEYEFYIDRNGAAVRPKTATTITKTVKDLVFSSEGTENVKLVTSIAGEYVFKYNDSRLTVTYPDYVPVEPITVYVVNSLEWADMAAYIWNDGEDPAVAWPGTVLTKVEDVTVNGFDVYSYTFEPTDYIIFNNNNKGSKTADLTPVEGQYYDLFNKAWYATTEEIPAPTGFSTGSYLYGSFNSWNKTADEFRLENEGDTVAVITLTLEADKDYEFKIIRNTDGKEQFTSAKDIKGITESVTGIVFSSSVSTNTVLTTTEAGEYKFYFDTEKSTLAVQYPGTELPEEMQTFYFDVTNSGWDSGNYNVVYTDKNDETVEVALDKFGAFYKVTIPAYVTNVHFVSYGEAEGTLVSDSTTIDNTLCRICPVESEDPDVVEYSPGWFDFSEILFIRGSFNNWGTDYDLFMYDESSYVTYVNDIPAGTYEYKVANYDWTKEYPAGKNKTLVLDNTANVAFIYTPATEDAEATLDVEIEYSEVNVDFVYNSEHCMINTSEDDPDTTTAFGENYDFRIDAFDGYTVAAVIYDMEELEAVDGVYTIENVTSDIQILVITVAEADEREMAKTIFLDADNNIIFNEEHEIGTTIELNIEAPYKEGYYFDGWSPELVTTTDEDGTVWYEVTGDMVYAPIFKDNNNDLPLLPGDPEVPDEPTVKTWTVIFVDDSGKYLGYQTVEDGKDATLPEVPAKAGYEFTGWDGEHTNVTENRTITANYTKKTYEVVVPTHGTLKIDVAGGTGFTMTVAGVDRPQGTSYHNSKIKIGTEVTVVAQSSTGNQFLGWINPASGAIIWKNAEYTFITSGNDNLKALFASDVDGVQAVIFKNDKLAGGNGQILDMQYYASTEAIVRPANTGASGWIFKGWMLEGDEDKTEVTDAMIQEEIAKGNDVTIVPIWEKEIVYVNITVNGGTGGGKVVANFSTTVTANAAPAGQKFAYWMDGNGKVKSYSETFTLYPREDMELTAVFVAEDEVIEEQLLVSLDSASVNTTYNGLSFSLSWYVPDEYDYVQGGIVAADKSTYIEANFYANSTDANVFTRGPKGDKNKPDTPLYLWTKPEVAVGSTWIAKAYVQYRDANGETVTVYSDVVEVTRTEDGVELN